MRKTTDKKIAPILCALAVVLLLVGYIALLVTALRGDDAGLPLAVVIGILYGVPILAVIFGVIAALRQRLREIDGGEEDEAKKY